MYVQDYTGGINGIGTVLLPPGVSSSGAPPAAESTMAGFPMVGVAPLTGETAPAAAATALHSIAIHRGPVDL